MIRMSAHWSIVLAKRKVFLEKKVLRRLPKKLPINAKIFVVSACVGGMIALIASGLVQKWDTHEPEPEYRINDTPLADRVRILCLVLTSEENHEKRAVHVKQTWAKRCNKLIFASSAEDEELGAKRFDVYDTSDRLWRRTKKMFEHAYVEHLEDYDWFYKADDDTYAFIDNMRYMLAAYSPNDPIYFGRKLKSDLHRQGYFYGGSGYVMSRRALQRFVEDAIPNEDICRIDWGGMEDYEMGNCMNNIGVYNGDSRDDKKRETFFPSHPIAHLFDTFDKTYYDKLYYKADEGLNCCSNYTIAFHYVEPWMMYFIEYLTYDLEPYGITHTHPPIDRDTNFSDIATNLDKETSNNL